MNRSNLAHEIRMHQAKLCAALDQQNKPLIKTLQNRLAAYNFIQSRGVTIRKQIRSKV